MLIIISQLWGISVKPNYFVVTRCAVYSSIDLNPSLIRMVVLAHPTERHLHAAVLQAQILLFAQVHLIRVFQIHAETVELVRDFVV